MDGTTIKISKKNWKKLKDKKTSPKQTFDDVLSIWLSAPITFDLFFKSEEKLKKNERG
jgi:hypothetical protein